MIPIHSPLAQKEGTQYERISTTDQVSFRHIGELTECKSATMYATPTPIIFWPPCRPEMVVVEVPLAPGTGCGQVLI